MKRKPDQLDAAAILSLMTGAAGGVGAYVALSIAQIPRAYYFALMAGLLTALVLFPIVLLSRARREKKYAQFEKTLSRVRCRADANFRTGTGAVTNGKMYLCEDEIVFASLEGRTPLTDRVAWDEVKAVMLGQVNVMVLAKDGRSYVLQTPDHDLVEAVMQKYKGPVHSGEQEGETASELSEIEPLYHPKPVLLIEAGESRVYAIFTDEDAAAALIKALASERVTLNLHEDNGALCAALPWPLAREDREGVAHAGDVILTKDTIAICRTDVNGCFSCAARIGSSQKLAEILSDGISVTLSLEWGE